MGSFDRQRKVDAVFLFSLEQCQRVFLEGMSSTSGNLRSKVGNSVEVFVHRSLQITEQTVTALSIVRLPALYVGLQFSFGLPHSFLCCNYVRRERHNGGILP